MLKDYFVHFHDFYEIEYIISGRCIQHINGESIECGHNSIVFMTPMDIHAVTLIEPTEIINLNFEASFIDSELSPFCDKSMYSHNMSDTLLNLLLNEYNSGLEYNLILERMLLNCIIAEIFRHANSVILQKTNHVVLDIARYIKLNYNTNITLQSLSNMFGYTPNYLSSQFHKNMGKTIKQFLSEVRLEHAAKSLLTSTASVTDVCFASGFTSLAHFLRVFKLKYNQSPGSYRKNRLYNKCWGNQVEPTEKNKKK